MTTGKTIALTRQTFVGKVMSLLLNMLSRLLITFLSRSKCLLISWLQSPSAVILEPPQNKVYHCFHCFSIYLPWSNGTVICRSGSNQIGKEVCQGCILSLCLFNFYAEYIMRNAGLEEAQAGIKIAKRNISNLRYADDTTLTAESEEELKSLLM